MDFDQQVSDHHQRGFDLQTGSVPLVVFVRPQRDFAPQVAGVAGVAAVDGVVQPGPPVH